MKYVQQRNTEHSEYERRKNIETIEMFNKLDIAGLLKNRELPEQNLYEE